jgi:hypothetical protein
MRALWVRAGDGQSIIALLAALARGIAERKLRTCPLGASWCFRIGAKTRDPLRTVSSRSLHRENAGLAIAQLRLPWTQSGHLLGKLRKARARPPVSPAAAAYAALLGSLAGFGGPALLASPWVAVLDGSRAEVLALLRRAEGEGLLRVRAAGGIVDIEVRRHMAAALEIPELADDR